ncbi:ABC transporter ATP-binding protein [Saccharothrix luteola]|uniref:ABC transporter ATP-binding protein n=1 Tax=Saccharothrix luteola TaxID=2893018 RepID=UPI001E41EE68|nr:ABC transporter ATP-binding protein [Saccharothrix luteola]MCC8243123.1 ABC transporter ATP-binding protein [Saccharothrix luteola]
MSELLAVRGLTVSFNGGPAVDAIDFSVPTGGALGIVGESGSGKSMASLAIMGLLPPEASRSGSISFGGQELTALSERRMRAVRGDRIAMVFQDPLSSLNPYYTVGAQIAEAYRAHRPGVSRRAARAAAVEAMERVHIREAGRRVDDYPHQFSGGMRQRVMIAMALGAEPELIIADEPTTALDVTVQAQILDLLTEVRRETGAALVLVTHDLAVVSEVADDLVVMRGGKVVEAGTAEQVFSDPQHPYTQALLDAVPRIDAPPTTAQATSGQGAAGGGS